MISSSPRSVFLKLILLKHSVLESNVISIDITITQFTGVSPLFCILYTFQMISMRMDSEQKAPVVSSQS